MSEKVEMETVTIQVPKAVMDFLRSYRENVQEYFKYRLLSGFIADIESCDGPFGNYNDIMKKFNLEPVFKTLNIPYSKVDC